MAFVLQLLILIRKITKMQLFIAEAQNNQLDILYIAPERMENATWITAAREMKIAMVVIDEAHCISIWGQSFRPNYRRIVTLVKLLPRNFRFLLLLPLLHRECKLILLNRLVSDIIPIRVNYCGQT